MVDQRILNGLATFSAGLMKRWLERNLYDRIFETELGEKLKGLDKKVRYGIEVGLNLLTAFFDQKLSEDTALKKFAKEVGIDAGPEISKRLINNTALFSSNVEGFLFRHIPATKKLNFEQSGGCPWF